MVDTKKEVIIQKVYKNNNANQKLVTIPKDCNISDEDFVFIQKVEFNRREIYKTDIEQIMFNALTKENIDFTFQYPIRGKYGYVADFFIESKKLIIECDGEAWHKSNNDHDRKAREDICDTRESAANIWWNIAINHKHSCGMESH